MYPKTIKLLIYISGLVLGALLFVNFSFGWTCILALACFVTYCIIEYKQSPTDKPKLKDKSKPVMIDRNKARKKYKEVESMGGLILFMDTALRAYVNTNRPKDFDEGIKLTVGYIDDMKAGIDDLIAVLEEMT